MNTKLNNETITLDKDEVFKNPKAEAIQWLQERKEKQMKPPIEEMTADQCYDELDRLRLDKQIRGRGNNPDAAHVRNVYYPAMKKQVKNRLRQLGAKATRPGDQDAYGPGQAAWQRAGGAT